MCPDSVFAFTLNSFNVEVFFSLETALGSLKETCMFFVFKPNVIIPYFYFSWLFTFTYC